MLLERAAVSRCRASRVLNVGAGTDRFPQPFALAAPSFIEKCLAVSLDSEQIARLAHMRFWGTLLTLEYPQLPSKCHV
jgi:hypothetical protein